MDIMEIILLIAGGVVFILSFFIPDRKAAAVVDGKELTEEEREKLIQEELSKIKEQADDLAERTERSLEKLSNEKIMAVDEYSETVLAAIHKNHEEAMFLYDMLNNKHTSLKNTLSEISRATKEAEKAIAILQDMLSRAAEQGGKEGSEKILPDQEAKDTAANKNVSVQEVKQGAGQEETTEEMTAFAQEGDVAGVNNNERILALYRQGKTAMAIAKELELGIGEVKLVIDLFRKA